MSLAGGEGDERAGRALDVLAGDLDRDAATDDVHDSALAYVVVAHRLATLELDRDSPALRRAEEYARRRWPRKQSPNAIRVSRSGSRGAKLSVPSWSRMPPKPATAAIQAPASEAMWTPSSVLCSRLSRSISAASPK